QRALANAERRQGPDADEVGLVLAVDVEVRRGERRQGRPGLPAGRNVLPLVLTDRTLRRGCFAGRGLDAAGGADVCRHARATPYAMRLRKTAMKRSMSASSL